MRSRLNKRKKGNSKETERHEASAYSSLPAAAVFPPRLENLI